MSAAVGSEARIQLTPGTPPVPERRSALQFIFSFPAMLGVVLIVLTVLTVRSRLNDPDVWWHLKTGEIIWNTHAIPRTDLFSFTTNNHPWTAHEWLSQVTIYGAWKAGGYTGLMIWLCIFPSAFFIAGYTLCSLYSGNSKVALLGALVTWFFATVGLAVRPHVLGYLFLTCELLIVHLARTKNPRWFFALPPLFAVWVNCHGSFILGLILLGAFLCCSLFDFRRGLLVAPRWEKSQRTMLFIVLALSIAGLFINPVGLKLITYPLDVILNQPVNLGSVDEWQPKFDDVRVLGMLAVAGFLFIWTLISRAPLYLDELVLFGLGMGMAARHSRMVFVFGVLIAPIMCRLLSNAWHRFEPARDRCGANAVIMLLAASVVVFSFPNSVELERQMKTGNPTQAVEYIRRMGLSGRMLNEYVYGGYLIWALPEQKVFIDGRADVYEGAGVLGEYAAWAMLRSDDPRILLDKYRVDFCLMAKRAPMSRVLEFLPGWKKIYSDDLSVIFTRT